MKYKVVITKDEIKEINPDACRLMEDHECILVYCRRDELSSYIEDADAILIGTERCPGGLIERAKKLKAISRYGVGYDAIDLEAATQHGIIVANATGCNSKAVADLTLLLMLLCSRNVIYMNERLKKGNIERPLGEELYQKTVGVIGTGRIGKEVISRCKGFGMKVLANDISDYSEYAKEYNVEYTNKGRIYCESDYITVHVPKTSETINMITNKEIGMMKKSVILINTSRGGVINEKDLANALINKNVAAAGVDVSVCEPAVDNPLVHIKNCIFTPHAGAATKEAYWMMGQIAAENVVEILETGNCKNRVN